MKTNAPILKILVSQSHDLSYIETKGLPSNVILKIGRG